MIGGSSMWRPALFSLASLYTFWLYSGQFENASMWILHMLQVFGLEYISGAIVSARVMCRFSHRLHQTSPNSQARHVPV